MSGITLLKGLEVEILEDGRLDVPDSLLAHLDLVVGAVRKHFTLPSAQQTAACCAPWNISTSPSWPIHCAA
ncbi:hypothetical protein QNM99_18690 [Pseudomonas sp. PCH446]